MGRAIISAVVGLVGMVIVVVAGDLGIWAAFGSSFVLDRENLTVQTGYCILNLVVGVMAALLGGYLASRLAGNQGKLAARILVIAVLLLGTIFIIMEATRKIEPLPIDAVVADMTPQDLAKHIASPTWYNFSIVVLGIMGVFLGAQYVNRFTGQALDESEESSDDDDSAH
jgi:uncharacterized membrane protein YeaQ/YmgE (transglycosylase-associated protein family)